MKRKPTMSDILGEIVSLDLEKIDLNDKEAIRRLIQKLLNIIEMQAKIIADMERENQNLKDEINRLKGEKGRPQIKPNVPRKENDLPQEKKRSKKWKKTGKKQRIKIDKTETLRVDPAILPPDAEHKGYRTVVVQNIRFETENTEYRLERYYSPCEQKLYEAELPEEVDGEFGAELKAFVHYLYFACRVPEEKIWRILTERGIIISKGQISNILTKDRQEEFSREKEGILEAGMACSDYFHIDDTGARHKGVNHYLHVICNSLFSAFFIKPRKNRDTIKEILGLNEEELMEKIMISDDAKQFLFVAALHALCWLHEIRHYRKMSPFLESHRAKLIDFLTEVWEFYEMLKEYKKSPDDGQKLFLERRFDELFSTETGYEELDRRISLTREKKDRLLLVLTYPQIPLHNNPAEIAVREFVIKKKISYGTRSKEGRIAWENMMSILDTCRKQGVSFLEYVTNIYSGHNMPRLAELIMQKGSAKPTSY
ncbi:MAG: transposase [Candidatus Hydrothermarchaeales archaeon]